MSTGSGRRRRYLLADFHSDTRRDGVVAHGRAGLEQDLLPKRRWFGAALKSGAAPPARPLPFAPSLPCRAERARTAAASPAPEPR
jgi:hypothetical protein